MNHLTNPFSPDKPIINEHGFLNYEPQIRDMTRRIRLGESCVVVGGIGMGKTSLLLKLKRVLARNEFDEQASVAPPLVPIYFRPHLSPRQRLCDVLDNLISAITNDVADWFVNSRRKDIQDMTSGLGFRHRVARQGLSEIDDFNNFDNDLLETVKTIRLGVPDARLVLLLDDFGQLTDLDVRDVLFAHLIELIDKERAEYKHLRRYMSVVMTSTMEVSELMPSLGSSLNWSIRCALMPVYLRPLSRQDVEGAISMFLEHTTGLSLAHNIIQQIYELTGGHPSFIQTILNDLWNYAIEHGNIDDTCIRSYESDWNEKLMWLAKAITSAPRCEEFLRLIYLHDPDLGDFSHHLDSGRTLNLRVQEAYQSLRFWGVLYEVEKQKHAYTNRFFREWFTPLGKEKSSEYYTRGLNTLRKRMEGDHEFSLALGPLESRLIEVNQEIEIYGADEEKRSRRHRIIDELNRFCRRAGLDTDFHKMCQSKS